MYFSRLVTNWDARMLDISSQIRSAAMIFSKKWGLLMSLVWLLLMPLATATAGMVGTDDILRQRDRVQLTELLERGEVKQQLIQMGIDPLTAKARVSQMTDEEVAQLNGRIAELPAGAGVSTTHLLLIIIIIILIL
jgi:hypothetical protein